MRPTLGQFGALGGLTLLALTGCYSYPYGAPYGYAPYPVMNTPASQPYLGAPAYSPGTTLGTPAPILTPATPGSTYAPIPSSPDDGTQTPNWPIEPGGSSAPTYRPEGNSAVAPDKQVPPPQDIPNFNSTSAPSNNTEAVTPFFEQGANESEPVELNPIETGPAVEIGDTSDPFQAPIPYRPASSSRTVTESETVSASSTTRAAPNPYDYDRKQFAWLRGVVDYDADDHSWNIIYSVNPDADDPHGGSITLSDSGLLDVLQNGNVVLLEGKPDPQQTDRSGKAKYQVSKVTLLQPK